MSISGREAASEQNGQLAGNDLISETLPIPTPASAIFDLLADPRQHRVFDRSGSVQGARPGGPERLSLGAHFGMDMKLGAPYRIENVVVEFEQDRRIAWRHFGRHVWRYLLEPVNEESTRVTEQFDLTGNGHTWAYSLLGYRRRNQRSIEQTLLRLESWAANSRAR